MLVHVIVEEPEEVHYYNARCTFMLQVSSCLTSTDIDLREVKNIELLLILNAILSLYKLNTYKTYSAYPSGATDFTPVFNEVRVVHSLVFFVVF